jgi:hypothetical protein
MRNLLTSPVSKFRVTDPTRLVHFGGWPGDETCGLFFIPTIPVGTLRCIASSGNGWDHVSVSLHNRLPKYREMCKVKAFFFEDDEVAVEYHVPVKDHVNVHPHTLHLWRPLNVEMPVPPIWMV